MREFVPFEGDYEKKFYDVRRISRRDKNGNPEHEIVEHCWPNAGFLNEIKGSQRSWSAESGVEFRMSEFDPMGFPQEPAPEEKTVKVCAWCPDKDVKTFEAEMSGFTVTHGVCEKCAKKL